MLVKLACIGILLGFAGVVLADETDDAPKAAAAPTTAASPSADGNLFTLASAETKQKMDIAEAAVMKDLEKSAAYLEAKIEVARQSARWDSAKNGNDLQERSGALTDLSAARRKLIAMVNDKLDQDAQYVELKKQYDSLMAVSKVQPADPDTGADAQLGSGPAGSVVRDPETAQAIRDAVKAHNFVVGMTYQECCRSAGSAPQQQKKDGDTKHCRWTLRGVTGSHFETKRGAFGGAQSYSVDDYGVTGYVHAAFVDNILTNFERRDKLDH